jgi:hypothetical protein
LGGKHRPLFYSTFVRRLSGSAGASVRFAYGEPYQALQPPLPFVFGSFMRFFGSVFVYKKDTV